MSENITSKINEVINVDGDGVKWNGTYYHNLLMENGDKINIGKKKQLERGQEITYYFTGEDDGQQEYKKAKPAWQGGGGGKGDTKGIKIGHAINNGTLIAIAKHGTSVEKSHIERYAKEIYLLSEKLNHEL